MGERGGETSKQGKNTFFLAQHFLLAWGDVERSEEKKEEEGRREERELKLFLL